MAGPTLRETVLRVSCDTIDVPFVDHLDRPTREAATRVIDGVTVSRTARGAVSLDFPAGLADRETLQVRYKELNIAEVLDLTVDEALEFFANIPPLRRKLATMADVGLGYIHLGQPAPTMSGGEAQRVKLSRELSKIATGRTLYILDEPSVGLHAHDVSKLIHALNKLVDKGNTVVIIEHNLDIIKVADWLVDLGPEGGDRGGELIAEGTPEQVMKVKNSFTGKYLKAHVK